MRENYTPIVLGVDASTKLTGRQIGGFLALTSGTLTVVNHDGTTIVNAVPVTAGIYTPLPFSLQGNDAVNTQLATVTLAGGASGTLGV